MFGVFLNNERRAAFRAGLIDRLVRRGEIAIGIAAATVEYASPSASF